MKRSFTIISVFLLQFAMLNAQYVIKSEQELAELKKLPLEKVYVHHNASIVLPGEYLYYSVYCMNAVTGKLDNISRMAYVEMVGEDLQLIFSQKVRLVEGRGQGDFFMPISVPSGNYKLIAYTQWMRNGPPDQMFQDDIAIINPYRVDQDAILTEVMPNTDSSHVKNGTDAILPPLKKVAQREDRSILLTTDRKTYGQREKVALNVKNFRGPLGYGNYSLSVRRKDMIPFKEPMRAIRYGDKYLKVDKIISKSINDSLYLPEQRGELFYGKVNNKDGTPAVGENVVISIPGKDFQLKSATTDENGNFYTYINKEYDAPVLIAQLLQAESNNVGISLYKEKYLSPKHLNFAPLKINASSEGALLQRSVHNQIENGFYGVKPDSILSIEQKDPFDGGAPEVILLDEFTRFQTLRETLVEIVPNVWVKKLENGSYTFWVKEDLETYNSTYEGDPPLVLVDGVFINSHNELLDFNARMIKKISILRDPLVLGSKKYFGMVSIETVDGNYMDNLKRGSFGLLEVSLPTPKKNYYRQAYDHEKLDHFKHIPDFRYQLLWEPHFVLNEDAVDRPFDFYTSDVPGEYEMVLEGFTSYGKPISQKEIFLVE